MPLAGFEQDAKTPRKTALLKLADAKSGALDTRLVRIDDRLAALMAAKVFNRSRCRTHRH